MCGFLTLKLTFRKNLSRINPTTYMLNHLKFKLFFILLYFNFATPVYAIDITLQWTPNNEPNLDG